ncbi:MAG: hypothetical protein FJ398_26435 [Verrucomicrobia bacterium]|nr:hypothetical protein [Verrucomicrobiota bacterium]
MTGTVNCLEVLNGPAKSGNAPNKGRNPVLVAGVLFLCLTGVVTAGEKIQITEGTEKIDLPSRVPKDDLFSKPLDFLKSRGGGGGSLIPDLPPPVQTSPLNKDRLDKTDWLKSTSGNFDKDAILKQIFGVREYKYENLEKRPKGSLDDSWGGTSDRETQKSPGSLLDRPLSRRELEWDRKDMAADPFSRLRERSQTGSGIDEESNNGSIADLNLNNLLHPTQVTDPFSRMPGGMLRSPDARGPGQFYNRTITSQSGRTREQELRALEFEKLLKGPSAIQKPVNDPINALTDRTRQEINPVKGTRLDNSVGPAISAIGAESSAGFGRASRPSFLDNLNTKVLGSSSLTPSIVAPAPARITEAKPPVLEIPRRKF